MLVDTHCHLLKEYYDNIEEIIKNALDAKVERIIICGFNRDSSEEAIRLSKKYASVYVTIGFHPNNVEEIAEEDFAWLEENLNNKKVIGVGEIGLDYYWQTKNICLQRKAFKRQLDIAKKYKMPVIIHSREATVDIYNILKDYQIKGIIHCYNDNLENAKKFIGLGMVLGIGGTITFKNNEDLLNVIKEVQLEYIVLETDSPYLTPEPYRGKRNQPAFIPVIQEKVAEIKGIDKEKIANITTDNVYRVFDKMR